MFGFISGGLIGVFVLMWIGLLFVKFVFCFDDFEYFWLMLLGLLLCVFIVGCVLICGLVVVCFGILFFMIGFDLIGNMVWYVDMDYLVVGGLIGGVSFIFVMIGLFGFVEVLCWFGWGWDFKIILEELCWYLVGFVFLKNLWSNKLILLGLFVLGMFVGVLFGVGVDVVVWVFYGLV